MINILSPISVYHYWNCATRCIILGGTGFSDPKSSVDMAQQPGTNGPTEWSLFTIQPSQNWGQQPFETVVSSMIFHLNMGIIWELYGSYMGVIWEVNIKHLPSPISHHWPFPPLCTLPGNAISAASRRRQQSSRSLPGQWMTPEDVMFWAVWLWY